MDWNPEQVGLLERISLWRNGAPSRFLEAEGHYILDQLGGSTELLCLVHARNGE